MAIKLKKTQTKEEFQKRDTLMYIYIYILLWIFFFFGADFGKSSGQNNTKGHMGTGTNPFNSLKRTPKKREEIG